MTDDFFIDPHGRELRAALRKRRTVRRGFVFGFLLALVIGVGVGAALW